MQARINLAAARANLTETYNRHHHIETFTVGQCVTIGIPRGDHAATDNRRLQCRVVGIAGNESRLGYKLRCEFGLLQKIYPTSTLASVSSAIQKEKADLISLSKSGNEITLAYAASKASTSNKAGVSCNCKKSCDCRRCRCFKNGLGCSIYCHSDDHDCGNMKPVAQRTEMSLMPRPAWDQSAASDGDNEDEPAPVQPVQPRRILRAKSVLARTRNASGLAGQLVPAPSSSSIFQSSPPIARHTRLESSNDSGQNPLSAPESSSTGSHLQPTAATSKRRTRSSNTAGMRASPDLNIITENKSRIKTRAVSHSRAARSGLPAESDNGRTGKGKGKEAC